MELNLQKESFACYSALPQQSELREQSAESIVPDYCPDIMRIVDASGCFFLRSYEIADAHISISGTLKVNLLYAAEESAGLKSYDYGIAVEESFDLPTGEQRCRDCLVEGMLNSLEIRALNPRKVFTRAAITFDVTPYIAQKLTLCGDIEEKASCGIETLSKENDISIVKAVYEKDFNFTDEITLSSAKEPAAVLLRSRASARITEAKPIGNKIILKGALNVELLYAAESGKLQRVEEELPFSQIIEGTEGSALDARAFVRLTGFECRLGTGDGGEDKRVFSLRAFLHAFVLVREERRVTYIADLYSTSHALTEEKETLMLFAPPMLLTQDVSVREQLETGTEAAETLSTEISFGAVSILREGEGVSLHTTASIHILYLDENATPLTAERRCEIAARMALPAEREITACEVRADGVTAAASSSGVEVRFTAVFSAEAAASEYCSSLCALSAEPQEGSDEPVPSLILRPLQPGQQLWDLAKRYRTTVADILAANDPEAAAVVGEMLLIPRKRT